MKNLALFLITFSTSIISFGQIDINTLNDTEKKILQVFKETYVEKNFKDPYSFQLLKMESKPITAGEVLLKNISFLKSELSELEKKSFTSPKKKNQIIDKIKSSEDDYSKKSIEWKTTIRLYEIRLDCYGNNLYGAKVLSRYKIEYFLLDYNMKPLNGKNMWVTEL